MRIQISCFRSSMISGKFTFKMVAVISLVFSIAFGFAILCSTGSVVSCQPINVNTGICLQKDEMGALRQLINYERTVRTDLDRDLTEMNRRYRQMIIEHDEIKAENARLKNYTDTVISEVRTENQQLREKLESDIRAVDGKHLKPLPQKVCWSLLAWGRIG